MNYCETIELKLNDGRNITIKDGIKVEYSTELKPLKFDCYQLKTGILLFEPKIFNGFMFLDNNHNFYDTFHKKIYFNYGRIFEGDDDKEAFSLFDDYNLIENQIKKSINNIKQEPDENVQKEIENNICGEIIKKLDNFDFNKILLKNGKYIYSDGSIRYIHDNIKVCYKNYENKEKVYESEFIQQIQNGVIYLTNHGIMKNYSDNTKREIIYNFQMGRYKVIGDENEKFFFPKIGNNDFKVIKKKKKEYII